MEFGHRSAHLSREDVQIYIFVWYSNWCKIKKLAHRTVHLFRRILYICILCIRICIYECKLITMFYVRKFSYLAKSFSFSFFFFSFTRRLSTCTRLLRKIMVRVCNLIAFSSFTNFLHIRKIFSFVPSIILRNLPTWNDFMLKKNLRIYNNRRIINSN